MSTCMLDDHSLQNSSSIEKFKVQTTHLTLWRTVHKITSEYEFLEKLTNTNQGAVYKARQLSTSLLVAIKVVSKAAFLNKSSLAGYAIAEDVCGEVSILSQLQDVEGILELVDAVEDSSYLYVITRFEAGGDLFDYLTLYGGQLLESEAQEIFQSICESVWRMHKRGICHLDLSLENVFLSETGELKLADFGVARQGTETKQSASSSNGLRVGKPKYMAPEIVENLEFDGFQADVYSLGVILFCLLYGVHPYDFPTSESDGYVLIKSGCLQAFLEISDFGGTRSAEAEELLQMMLAPAEDRAELGEVLSHPWIAIQFD